MRLVLLIKTVNSIPGKRVSVIDNGSLNNLVKTKSSLIFHRDIKVVRFTASSRVEPALLFL